MTRSLAYGIEQTWIRPKKLETNLNIDTRRQIQAHQRVNCLSIGIHNVDQTFVRPNLEMFVRILSINELRRTVKRSLRVGSGIGPKT